MVLIWLLLGGFLCHGAIPPKQAVDKKLNQYMSNGVVFGGESGAAFSLLNIRRDFSVGLQTERLIFDFGDKDGKPLMGRVGFFHVAIDAQKKRIIIDLDQVQKSKLDQQKLLEIIKKSPFIKSAHMTFDPQDLSTNLTLNMKGPIEVEVFEMPSQKQASRLVLDLKRKQ